MLKPRDNRSAAREIAQRRVAGFTKLRDDAAAERVKPAQPDTVGFEALRARAKAKMQPGGRRSLPPGMQRSEVLPPRSKPPAVEASADVSPTSPPAKKRPRKRS